MPVVEQIVGRWPDGKSRVIVELQEDIRIGERHLRQDGRIERVAKYRGAAATWQALDDSGRVAMTWHELSGQKHGEELRYDSEGRINQITPWRMGRRHGQTQWFADEHKVADQLYEDGAPVGPLTSYWPTGQKRSTVLIVEDRRDGQETRWYPSGGLMAEIQWKLGILHGPYRTYSDAGGWLQSEVQWTDGLPSSDLTTFYPGGARRMTVPLLTPRPSDGPDAEPVRHGLARVYTVDGLLLAELPYVRDKIHGTEKRFASDGSRTLEQEYCEGEPCTMLRLYFPSGRLMARQLWRNPQQDGVEERFADADQPDGITALAPDVASPLTMRIPLVAGRKNGEALVYGSGTDGPVGQLLARLPFADDLRHGAEVRLYPSGKKQAEFPWDRGSLRGMVWTWHENGQPQSVYPVDGEMGGNGLERRWDDQGRLRFEVPLVGGKKHGVAKVYGPQQQLEATLTFADDLQDGPETRFRPTGKAIYTWRQGLLISVATSGKRRRYVVENKPIPNPVFTDDRLLDEPLSPPDEPKPLPVAKPENNTPARPQLDPANQPPPDVRPKPVKGVIKMWYDDAQTRLESVIPVTGNGTESHYHENGELRFEVPIVGGKRQGLGRICDETGSLWATVPYVQGERHGDMIRYARTGERIESYPFRNGKPFGVVQKWYLNGRRHMEYTHDPVAPKGSEMAWHKNGQLRMTVPLQRGQRHGIAVIFSEVGKRWSEQTWVAGQQQGIERRLGPSGDVIRTLTWANGKVVADTAPPAGQ